MEATLQLLFERREQKYPLSTRMWRRALSCARRLLPVERYDGRHAITNIRTVYLDTPGMHSSREYMDECPVRTKLRLRQYGYDGRLNGVCWVEIKTKRYGTSLKQRFKSGRHEVEALLHGRDIEDHVSRMNDGNPQAHQVYRRARALIASRALRPVVRVDYERVAFQRPGCRDVRLTLDRSVRFQANGRGSAGFGGVLLELKICQDEPVWLPELLGHLSVRDSSSFSKYAQAVQKLRLNGDC